MRAGNMDRVIIIETSTVTMNEYRVPVTSWSPLVTLRAQLLKNSTDNRDGQRTVTDATMTFRSYWHPSVTLECHVTFEGESYRITSIKELGRRAGMDLSVERVGP